MSPLLLILGIRPDVIRAALIIKYLRDELGEQFVFAWSGQHYSDNLKDVFFRELGVGAPDIEMNVSGHTDAEIVASMIRATEEVIEKVNPKAVVFLGDTNTVMGSVACATRQIPIIHIEGCMRSYDWRMPEEKFRTVIDHLADVIYAYLPEYKSQGELEGLDPDRIIVTGNPIVDILDEFFINGSLRMNVQEKNELFEKYNIHEEKYFVMTCHRRENVESTFALKNIMKLASFAPYKVIFAAGYRTQRELLNKSIDLPGNVTLIDPIGYRELLELMVDSAGVLTDSGTVVEESAVLGIPSVQMRTSTERPQVYDCGSSLKFDPHLEVSTTSLLPFFERLDGMKKLKWEHKLGDGNSSRIIVSDLIQKFRNDSFARNIPTEDRRPVSRNFGTGMNTLGFVYL